MERNGMQTAILNVVGVIAGTVVMLVLNMVIGVIANIILQFPIISVLLSWPSTPVLYAMSAANFGSLFAGDAVCYKICGATKNGFKPGMAFYGLLCFVLFLWAAYDAFLYYGFSDPVVCHILGAVASAFIIRRVKVDPAE